MLVASGLMTSPWARHQASHAGIDCLARAAQPSEHAPALCSLPVAPDWFRETLSYT